MLACRLVSKRIVGSVRDLPRNRGGSVAIEYGLLAGMITIALVGILTMADLAEHHSAIYDLISDTLSQ